MVKKILHCLRFVPKGGFVLLILSLIVSCSPNQSQKTAFLSDEQATIDLFAEVSPSVVFIKNASVRWNWFSMDIYEIPQGAGSGFVWDKKGHIITNLHVIYQADTIEVILSDQKSYEARIVGFSADHDLAVLKIDAPSSVLHPVTKGVSHNLKVGQKVLSIGNPFGLDHTLTTGVVSALGRSIKTMTKRKIYDVIQTDAAINPGNSGGPLLDSSGNLIGVSTAIFSPSGAYAGVSFAIPVDIVKRVVPQLIEYGKVKRVGLGIIVVPESIRQSLGIKGVLLQKVANNGSASQAGLRPTERDTFGNIILGDVIVEIDGIMIESNEDLFVFFDKGKKPGNKIDVKFMRGGKEHNIQAVLQELQ
jgi:S1-C subfamily serine protease